MDLDLAQTEDAHPLSPSSPAAGSDETKETSLGSQVSSTSLEDTEDVGNEKQEGEKEKDKEEEEVEKEDVEGGSKREKREDILASSTGPAGPDTVETSHASKDTVQKQKNKKKKGGKSRKKREAQRRYGPPHLDRETIKRAKVSMRIIAFFYHLSLSVLVATWTELLLKGFDNNFSKAAAFLGTCQGVERGIQFLTAASLGNLSDCVGRRPVLFASLILNIISTLCVIVKPGPMTVLAYFIISGLSNCILAMLNAIVGDLAAGREELEGGLTQQYGRLGMAIGLAMMVGPMLGPSIQQFNVVYPLYISITLVIICVLICLSMAESLPPQNRHIKLEHSNPLWGLKKAMRYRPFLLFALPFFLSQLSESVYAFIVIYTKQRLGWSYVSVGLYISLLALTIAILQGNLRHIVPRFVSGKSLPPSWPSLPPLIPRLNMRLPTCLPLYTSLS
ncbi:major facilitator superfamily mfs_1 [Nannochloropsis gaditana]|uniref:Major facilitator superfamily mfs_1 n=1 Tax=Nannochloropsis gaditana TaxID=72520 RepID=W7U2N8_9STRA|nr:major facilitator superfamily mfs_1 [Nannochloropsis gaditana]